MNLSPSDPAHARIGRAEAYPYDRPSVAYLFDAGTIRPLGPDWHVERTAVVACGSNGAPSRLAQKFTDGEAQIPVTPAWLQGHAVVYSAHFTSYGSLPATLHACPGAQTRLSITWLTAGQLERMHRSEGAGQRYDYVELDQLELVVDGHGTVTRAGAYVSRRGPLTSDGEPVRLAEVITRDCPLPAYPQRSMLRRVHRDFAPHMTYPAFMTRILESPAYRQEVTARLEARGMAGDALEGGAP